MHNLHIFRNQTCQLDKIAPLENGTLVTFVNNCLYAMIEQLNNFACYVESRMITLNRKIDICHSNLVILEMKLNSINVPKLTEATSQESSAALNSPINDNSSSPSTNQVPTLEKAIPANSEAPHHDELDSTQKVELGDGQAVEEEESTNSADSPEDLSPELEKYRKMLRFGVHESAVRQKMLLEGEDPARLNL